MTARFLRNIHLGRIIPELEPSLDKQITEGTCDVKRLKTRRNIGRLDLPVTLDLAAQKRCRERGTKEFRKEVGMLNLIMSNFKLPDDKYTIKNKIHDIKTTLDLRDRLPEGSDYDPSEKIVDEERMSAKDRLSILIDGKLMKARRDWHYYQYDEYASNLYMATRLAPNYASIKTVMNEIKSSDPNFTPSTVLDFGSGMGTTIWAVNETWPEKVREFLNIEISKEQQELCEYLLRGARETSQSLDAVFHRQYLPTSTKVQYDLVVSAFSLLELPNAELRAHTIENLWNKTKDLLVIIERGNSGGFSAVNEARHFILELGGHNVVRKINLSSERKPFLGSTTPKSHVLAPCPHEYTCPRAQMSDKNRLNVCRFRVSYEPLEVGMRRSPIKMEEFSYVVLRKGPHSSHLGQSEVRWPRIVEKRKCSGKQITHRLCCGNGNLAETVITSAKYGKAARQLSKACDWGDILPIKIKDEFARRQFIDEAAPSDSDKSIDTKDAV